MSKELDKAIARMNAIMDRLDIDFVEAAHYDRERSYRVDSPTQVPMASQNPDNLPSIQFYAPTNVSVLGFPVLYCIICNADHPCAYTHKVNDSMGVCAANYSLVKPEQYVTSERVQTEALRSHTGTLTRA